MPVTFPCPACGRQLQAPDDVLGQAGACTHCRARIVAPNAAGEPARLAPPTDTPAAPPPPVPPSMPPAHRPANLSSGVPGQAGMPDPFGVAAALDYAPFWKRLVGFLADSLVLLLLYMVLNLIFAPLNPWPLPDLMATLESAMNGTLDPVLAERIGDPMYVTMNLTYSMVWTALLHWLYFAGFQASGLQATPGKLLVWTRVTDLSGQRLTFGRATARAMAKGLSALPCYLGYLPAAFTERRQALHDMLAQTVVLNR